MLLRIVDCQPQENSGYSIRIFFESKGKSESYLIDSYRSPFSDNFRKTLDWYFKDYFDQISIETAAPAIPEKLIKLGQYIGDEILGEDHQLIRIKEIIEEQGYHNLEVQIESGRIEFFSELWEAIVLPESKYILSAVAKSYIRRCFHENEKKDYPELRYDLKVTPSSKGKIAKVLQGAPGENYSKNEISLKSEKPLKILYLLSRPDTFNTVFKSSNSINQSLSAISSGGAIEYEIRQIIDWQEFKNRLSNKIDPVHIIHYDGPVIYKDGKTYVVLVSSSASEVLIDTNTFFKSLVDNNVSTFFLDARAYLKDNKMTSAGEGLAEIAMSAHQQGLGNIIGLGHITNPWISEQCFGAVYTKITSGLSLAQAVVEARKMLQANTETSLVTYQPMMFHPWPLLIHYSKQVVNFFESPQDIYKSNNLQELELFREKLFGFRSDMLPPLLNQVGDGQAVELIDQLSLLQATNHDQILSIVGEQGIGKSQLAHLISIYLAEKQKIDYAFYFDFNDDYFHPDDILRMISPVFGFEANKFLESEEKLKNLHCCFVFDNFTDCGQKTDSSSNSALQPIKQFIQKFASLGHIFIFIGQSCSNLHELAAIKLEKLPLQPIEQKILTAYILQNSPKEKNDFSKNCGSIDMENLLSTINGNPWLIKKTAPMLTSVDAGRLSTSIIQNVVGRQDNLKIESFYEWQWATLPPIWQQLLCLCGTVKGLLLEMLMIATENNEFLSPEKNIFILLGDVNAKFSDGISIWENSGFINRTPHGRTVDSRCASFLMSKYESCFNELNQTKVKFVFSQLVCGGVQLLSNHIINQPNPAIFKNLLINRRHWVEHFENLWFHKDFKGFFEVKSAFDNLLKKAKLENESKIWAINLLERSPLISSIEEKNSAASMAWLALAISALDQDKAKNSKCISSAADVCKNWFYLFPDNPEKQQIVLFLQVATFLESFYFGNSNYQECIEICEKASGIYKKYEAWRNVVQTLKTLVKCHIELGDKDKALAAENKIIDEIKNFESNHEIQNQQMLEILFSRIARLETDQAQNILNKLKQAKNTEKLADILDGAQCDICFQQGNYLTALPYYSKMWDRAIQTNQGIAIQQLKNRLTEIENKIGTEEFDKNFEMSTPTGTIKPKDYSSLKS